MKPEELAAMIKRSAQEYELNGHGSAKDVRHGAILLGTAFQVQIINSFKYLEDKGIRPSEVTLTLFDYFATTVKTLLAMESLITEANKER